MIAGSSPSRASRKTRPAYSSVSLASISPSRWTGGSRVAPKKKDWTSNVDEFVSAQNARLKKNKRPAVFLFAAAVAFVFAGAAHAEPKKPASSQDGKYFDADGNPTYNVSADGK